MQRLKGSVHHLGVPADPTRTVFLPFFVKTRMYRDAWRLHGIWYMLHVILDFVYNTTIQQLLFQHDGD